MARVPGMPKMPIKPKGAVMTPRPGKTKPSVKGMNPQAALGMVSKPPKPKTAAPTLSSVAGPMVKRGGKAK